MHVTTYGTDFSRITEYGHGEAVFSHRKFYLSTEKIMTYLELLFHARKPHCKVA